MSCKLCSTGRYLGDLLGGKEFKHVKLTIHGVLIKVLFRGEMGEEGFHFKLQD